jgi:hypothetical protein
MSRAFSPQGRRRGDDNEEKADDEDDGVTKGGLKRSSSVAWSRAGGVESATDDLQRLRVICVVINHGALSRPRVL